MVTLRKISRDWNGPVIVAASGPGLSDDVAAQCAQAQSTGWRVIAVNDAYRRIPSADALYACDARWWAHHGGAQSFRGEKWTTHEDTPDGHSNDKSDLPAGWGLRYVRGRDGKGFSTDPSVLHYGGNSGFQAMNLALLRGATRLVLVGFDMRGRLHFFGSHPASMPVPPDYNKFVPAFREAAKHCATPIVNATPGSALDCWPVTTLWDAMNADDLLHSDRAVGHG